MKKLLLIFFSFPSLLLAQQNGKIDSLKNLLKTSKEDTVKVKILLKLSEINAPTDPGQGLKYGEQALAIAEKLSNKPFIAEAWNWMGESYRLTGDFDKALECGMASLKIQEELGAKTGICAAHNNIGNVYLVQGNYDKALENFLISMKISEDAGDKSRVAITSSNIGVLLSNKAAITHNIMDYQEAIKYNNKALALDKELGDKYSISIDLNNIGTIYADQGKLQPTVEAFTKAIDYYQQSLAIKKEVEDKDGIAIALVNICDANIQLGKLSKKETDFSTAISFGQKSLVVFNEVGDQYGYSFCLNKLGEAFGEKGELLNNAKLLDSSLNYYNKALKLSQQMQTKDVIKDIYSALSDVYELKSNYKESLKYHRLFSDIKDTLLNEESTKHMNEMRTKYESVKKDKEIITQKAEAEKQGLVKNGFIIGFILMFALAFFIFRGYRQKQKANVEISHQKKIIEEKQKEIVDSINYAKRIQYALLAQDELLRENLTEHFVLFMPKDIVSGDFYWATKKAGNKQLTNGEEEKIEKFYLAVCDSTGHGVPGAFMSLLNISFLNEAIIEKNILEPNEVLNHVRKRLIENISQDGGQDGMDAVLVCFDKTKNILTYAAAHNTPVVISNGELKELDADKMPVGKGEKTESFTQHAIDVKAGDTLYLFTDGYADQFGGQKGKKFRYKQLNELFLSINKKPIEEQKNILSATLHEWKGTLEQVDDVCVIGIRI